MPERLASQPVVEHGAAFEPTLDWTAYMALITFPLVGLALLPHASGGAILAHGGAYLGGTFVGAPIVTAFTTAGGVLAKMGAAVAVGTGLTASSALPVVAGVTAIAVVAMEGYCLLHGVPSPIGALLAKAGIGSVAAKGALAVPLVKLAAALILLAAAGFVVYLVYQGIKEYRARHKADLADLQATAAPSRSPKEVAESLFGREAWATFGEAGWSAAESAYANAARLAEQAVKSASTLTDQLTSAAAVAGKSASDLLNDTGVQGRLNWWRALWQRIGRLFRRKAPAPMLLLPPPG